MTSGSSRIAHERRCGAGQAASMMLAWPERPPRTLSPADAAVQLLRQSRAPQTTTGSLRAASSLSWSWWRHWPMISTTPMPPCRSPTAVRGLVQVLGVDALTAACRSPGPSARRQWRRRWTGRRGRRCAGGSRRHRARPPRWCLFFCRRRLLRAEVDRVIERAGQVGDALAGLGVYQRAAIEGAGHGGHRNAGQTGDVGHLQATLLGCAGRASSVHVMGASILRLGTSHFTPPRSAQAPKPGLRVTSKELAFREVLTNIKPACAASAQADRSAQAGAKQPSGSKKKAGHAGVPCRQVGEAKLSGLMRLSRLA